MPVECFCMKLLPQLSWQKKSLSVPALHLCKAEELTPKCFRKDQREEILPFPFLRPNCERYSVLERCQTEGGKEKKRKGN